MMLMKKITFLMTLILLAGLFSGCQTNTESYQIVATTLPVYEFTSALCTDTDITVGRLITESVSCLHDYTLQTSQMRMIEAAEAIVISGAGLEDFLDDPLSGKHTVIDAAAGIPLLCSEHEHDHSSHTHEEDPHIWLSPENATEMAINICSGLTTLYPQYTEVFLDNLEALLLKFDALKAYGSQTLSQLSSRELITFHDGFSYFADAFDLTILKAIEEESGSEASAAELKEIITLVEDHTLPAIFTERSGSDSAAKTVSAETGTQVLTLDMAMAGDSYFDAMYHNIDTVKEGLG